MITDLLTNPTVLAALLAAGSAVLGALLAYRIKFFGLRENIYNRSLSSQMDGWDKYTARLAARISELEGEIERKEQEWNARVSALELEMKRRDDACNSRIKALENDIRDLKYK